jgi:hypothetical protein
MANLTKLSLLMKLNENTGEEIFDPNSLPDDGIIPTELCEDSPSKLAFINALNELSDRDLSDELSKGDMIKIVNSVEEASEVMRDVLCQLDDILDEAYYNDSED